MGSETGMVLSLEFYWFMKTAISFLCLQAIQ